MTIKWVCAIDVGVYNVGFAVWPVKYNKEEKKWEVVETKEPELQRCSFLSHRDGKVYETFEEKYTEELVEGWIYGRWHKWLRKAGLVLVER